MDQVHFICALQFEQHLVQILGQVSYCTDGRPLNCAHQQQGVVAGWSVNDQLMNMYLKCNHTYGRLGAWVRGLQTAHNTHSG